MKFGYETIEKAQARAERRGETVVVQFRDGSYGSYPSGEILPTGARAIQLAASVRGIAISGAWINSPRVR